MQVHHKHFNLIGKPPKYIDLRVKRTGDEYRVPYYKLENSIDADVRDLIDAFEKEDGNPTVYVYSAYHQESGRAYMGAYAKECELLGQPLEE